MEAILIRQSLWRMVEMEVVEGKTDEKAATNLTKKKEKQSKEKIAQARAEMILQVKDNQLVHMKSCNPMEVWATLENIHRALGFATVRRQHLGSCLVSPVSSYLLEALYLFVYHIPTVPSFSCLYHAVQCFLI